MIVSLVLRLWGNDFGLPNLYHPDEDAVLMPAINIIKTGDLEPTRLEYGSLHIYVLAAVSAFVFLLSARSGFITEAGQLTIYQRGAYPPIYIHPEYFLAARSLSAIMGTAAVLIIYMLARRLGNGRQALIASGIAAVLPRLITHAHFATTDTPLLFWVTLGLYLLVRTYDNWHSDDWRAYAGAGFVCGLATSTKYNGVFLAFPLFLIPLLREHTLDNLIRFRVVAGPIGMLAGFLVGTPYALINITEFLRWFGYSLRLYNAPRELAQPSWLWHLRFHLASIHVHIFLMGLIGGLVALYLWRRRGLIIFSFSLLLWLGIISQTGQQARMWLPSAPAFIIWSALVIDLVVTHLRKSIPSSWPRHAPWAIPIIMILPLLAAAIGLIHRFQQPEVRTLTQQWVEANIPPGSNLAVDYFPPVIDPNIWQVTRTFHLYDHDLPWYQENGIQYLIMSGPITDPDHLIGTALRQYQALVADLCLIDTVSGPFLSDPKQTYQIYRMPPCQ